MFMEEEEIDEAMPCLPVVHVSMPDTVKLSGSTTLKVMKAIYNWTVTGFDICPDNAKNIKSPVFFHPNSSKWCVELKKDSCGESIRFHLVASSDGHPVGATLKASLLDWKGAKHIVYSKFYKRELGEVSDWDWLMENFNTAEFGDNWTFECEVCTVEVVMEDTSGVSEEEVQSAVGKDLEHLLDSKDLTDITLSAGGVQLEAHRAILCARSPVFRAMLGHDTKEAQESRVEIPDLEPEVVSEMLHYMYTDRVQVASDTMDKLLVAFDKYGLEDAKLNCEMELVRQLTVDRAATIAVYAILHSCSLLQKVCIDFIKQNIEQVMGSRGWAEVIDKHPMASKTISELAAVGSQRCASSPATTGSQSEATAVNSSAVEPISECHTPLTHSGNSDVISGSGNTCCKKKKVIYVWTVSGLRNWPCETGNFSIASPSFCHPETIKWEVRLYKCNETECEVYFQVLENKVGQSVIADLSISVIFSDGVKCRIHKVTNYVLEVGLESDEAFKCKHLGDDLTLECQIDMVCVIQHCAGVINPVVGSRLVQDLHSLLQSGNFTDFKLCTGTVEFSAHRAILMARSPIFARMLQPGTKVLQEGQFEVCGVKPAVLAEVLHYMYTGRVENLDDSTGELLAAAHRFELPGLKRECIALMAGMLDVGNAVTTAVCAVENQCDMLLRMCVEFIRSRTLQVMATTEWFKAVKRHPTVVKRIGQLLAESGR